MGKPVFRVSFHSGCLLKAISSYSRIPYDRWFDHVCSDFVFENWNFEIRNSNLRPSRVGRGKLERRDLLMEYRRETAVRLADVYRRLRHHFDYAHPWWPGSPFQIAVTAVLVQQCDWGVAWEAVLRLPRIGASDLPNLAETTPQQLHDALQKVTFAPTKSQRLIQIARRIQEAGFGSIDHFLAPERERKIVRDEALDLPGVGPETADCWLNFASIHPAFVVDAYTRRIFERLNIVPDRPTDIWRRGSYVQLQEFFEIHLLTDFELYAEFDFPADLPRDVALLRDYHALLVELGKHHCLKSKPRCDRTGNPGWPNYPYCEAHCRPGVCSACPLSELCRFSRN